MEIVTKMNKIIRIINNNNQMKRKDKKSELSITLYFFNTCCRNALQKHNYLFILFFQHKSLNYRTWPAPAFIVASIRILCVQSFGRQVGVHMVPIVLLDMWVHDGHQFAALGGQVLNHVHAV